MTLLTVRTAAQRLGVGYSTLKQWIYTGAVRTTTTAGGHHRIADAEIGTGSLASLASPFVTHLGDSPGSRLTTLCATSRPRMSGSSKTITIPGFTSAASTGPTTASDPAG